MTAVSSICSALNYCFHGKNDKYVRKCIDYGGRDIEKTKSDYDYVLISIVFSIIILSNQLNFDHS